MAIPDYIAANSNFADGGTSVTVTIPTTGPGGTVTAGMRAVLVLAVNPGAVSSGPGVDWTLQHDGLTTNPQTIGRMWVWDVEVGATAAVDPGETVSITLTGSSRWVAAIFVCADSDVDDLAVGAFSDNPDTTVTSPVATASDSARVFHVYGVMGNAGGAVVSWGPDGATTEIVDTSCTHVSSRNSTIMIAHETIGAPGSTTARTATSSTGVADQRVRPGSFAIVLSTSVTRPTADAGPSQTVATNATGVQLDGTLSGGAGAPFGPFTWRIISDGSGGASLSSTTVEDPTLDVGPNAGQVVLGFKGEDSAGVESLEDTVTITVLGAGSTAVPISDVTTTGWGKEPSTAVNHYDVISDGTDSTYIYYVDPAGNVVAEFGLSELLPPTGSEPVTVWCRPSMFEGTSGSMTTILKEGASTVIATFGPDNWTEDETVQQFDHELSAGQVSSISDWSNLRLRFEGTVS